MTPAQLTPILLVLVGSAFVVTYALYFRKRRTVAAAGGQTSYDQQQLDKYLGLTGGPERVTAAWIATTVPQPSARNTAINVAGVVMAVTTGTGVEVVGRAVLIACTSADRLLYMDQESRRLTAMHRGEVQITGTGRKGTKRTEQNTWGFLPGTVLSFAFANGSTMELDIISSAAPTLVDWSRGASVAQIHGPYAPSGTY